MKLSYIDMPKNERKRSLFVGHNIRDHDKFTSIKGKSLYPDKRKSVD